MTTREITKNGLRIGIRAVISEGPYAQMGLYNYASSKH